MDRLYQLGPPWLHIVAAGISETCDFGWSQTHREDLRVVVRFLRGHKMQTIETLYDEFAAALQFPYYFGENWPAFDECIADLEWLPGDAYLLIITNAELLLSSGNLDDLSILIRILQKVAEEWSKPLQEPIVHPAVPFHVIFQCDMRYLVEVRSRLTSAGAFFNEFSIEQLSN